MKTIKSILIATTLICASVVSTLSAQQDAQPQTQPTFNVAIGDSVMINRDCERYLTGERMSLWVYDVVHVVKQLGTKRFPEGVMLDNGNGGILSWVCQECFGPLVPKTVVPAEQPTETPAEKPAEQPAQTPTQEPVKEPAKQPIATPVETPAETPAETPVETPVEEPAQEPAKSGYHRFTIGVRGGAASLLHSVVKGEWICGGDALLDLQYAHYWTKENRPVDLGIIVGLGVGYAQSGMKAAVDTAYTVSTSDGDIDYTLKADEVKENDGQIQLEVPLMFSLIHEKGLFFNIGPKFMIPVYTPYKQNIKNPNINAYFPAEGVNVSNEVITGLVQDNQLNTKGTDNGTQFKINVMLTAEIGYEWKFQNGNSLGLGAYANYSVFNSFKNQGVNKSLMDVTPPSSTGIANVDILSATSTYAEKLGYFDAGIKLAYHFNFYKK
jgi:hypothetical protein